MMSANPHRSHLHLKAVGKRHMRESGIGLRPNVNLRARARRELFVSGNKVGMQMSLEYVPNCKTLLVGRL